MKIINLNYNQIQGHVSEVLRQLSKDNWNPDYIVGISRGGLLPATLISQYLHLPMYTLKVTLRDGIDEDCDHNAWMAEDAIGYENNEFTQRKNILIVDDINDSGETIEWIKKDWACSAFYDDPRWETVWNNNVRFATVVNNIASKERVNYYGMEINKVDDPAWIEFPWENWWKKT